MSRGTMKALMPETTQNNRRYRRHERREHPFAANAGHHQARATTSLPRPLLFTLSSLTLVLEALVGGGEDDGGLGLVGVGDPGLGAVEQPVVALVHRRGRRRARVTACNFIIFKTGFENDN